MKKKLPIGWIPCIGRNHTTKLNPIRHYFNGLPVSLCGRVAIPPGVQPVATTDDGAMNCAVCAKRKMKA